MNPRNGEVSRICPQSITNLRWRFSGAGSSKRCPLRFRNCGAHHSSRLDLGRRRLPQVKIPVRGGAQVATDQDSGLWQRGRLPQARIPFRGRGGACHKSRFRFVAGRGLPQVRIPVCGRGGACHKSGFWFVARKEVATSQDSVSWQGAGCHKSGFWFVARCGPPNLGF